ELAQARHRPAALRVLPDMVNWVNQEPGWDWHKGFYPFLKHTFGERPPDTRPDDGTVFEYVLAELEKQGLLDTLFSDVEGAYEGFGAWQLTLRLTLATRYRDHPRVQLSQAKINARVLSLRANLYRVKPEPGAPCILLDREEDLVVGRGM